MSPTSWIIGGGKEGGEGSGGGGGRRVREEMREVGDGGGEGEVCKIFLSVPTRKPVMYSPV